MLSSADENSRPRAPSDAPYKLLVLGDRGVGKSSMVKRYVNDTFQPDHDPTVGVKISTKSGVVLEGQSFNIQITELSGKGVGAGECLRGMVEGTVDCEGDMGTRNRKNKEARN